MARLPVPGSDDGTWGDVLNDYLSQVHAADGTLKDNSVTSGAIASGAVTKSTVGLNNVDNTSDVNKPVSTATQTALNLKAPLASPAFTGTPTGITKTHVGLGNVDNTSDVNKPVSTATQTALNLKAPLASPTFSGTVTVPAPITTTAPATKTYVDSGGPTVWVLDNSESRPTSGGPTGSGVQVGDIVLRRPA